MGFTRSTFFFYWGSWLDVNFFVEHIDGYPLWLHLILPLTHPLAQYTRLFAHTFTVFSIFTSALTNRLHYRLRKNDTPLPLNRRPPAIVYAGTPPPALPIPCLIIVPFLLLLFHNSPLPHAHPAPTKTHTHCTPPHTNRRRLPGTIRRFPASSSRHDGLGSHRYGLWRGVRTAQGEREGGWDACGRWRTWVWGWDGKGTEWGGEGEEEEGNWRVANRSVLGGPICTWPTSLVYVRNSGDGKRIRSTSVHVPLPWGTAHRPPHARLGLPASLGTPWRSMERDGRGHG